MQFSLFTKRLSVLSQVFPRLEPVSPLGPMWTFGSLELGDLEGLNG